VVGAAGELADGAAHRTLGALATDGDLSPRGGSLAVVSLVERRV
jgi:hypothetical protein